MELEIVDFELAKMLKEVGFNLETFTCYNGNTSKLIPTYELNNTGCEGGLDYDDFFTNYNNEPNLEKYCECKLYSAPTLHLVQMWFMEVYRMSIRIDDFYTNGEVRFDVSVQKLGNNYENSSDVYETYNQALSTGLKECCKLIKK